MKLLITGPQGSGKTSQSRRLSEHLGLCLVKTGEMCRAFAEEDSADGRSAKHALTTGALVDDRIVGDLVRRRVESPICANGFVADGFPRSMSQLEKFDPDYDLVFLLDISDEVAQKRMFDRGREDDSPDLIKERLRIYHQETETLIAHYRKLGKLIVIDGNASEDEVEKEIRQKLKERKLYA